MFKESALTYSMYVCNPTTKMDRYIFILIYLTIGRIDLGAHIADTNDLSQVTFRSCIAKYLIQFSREYSIPERQHVKIRRLFVNIYMGPEYNIVYDRILVNINGVYKL